MKLGTAVYGFRQWTIQNYLYAAAGLGVKYVEIGGYEHGDREPGGTMQILRTVLRDEDGIANLKALAQDAGVKIGSVVDDHRLWGVSQSQLDVAKATIRLNIETAARLDIGVLRVTEIEHPPDTPEEEVFDEISRVGIVLNELAETAEEHGVTIVAENYRASSDLMLAIASHFSSPAVGLHFDSHNYCRVGENPAQALRKIKDYVKYVHVKDYRAEDGRVPPSATWWPSWAVGEGEIDWKPVFQELAGFYQGIVAIEYEKYLEDVLRGFTSSVRYVRDVWKEMGIAEQ